MQGAIHRAAMLLLAGAGCVVPASALAQGLAHASRADYPVKPVRMIVPLAPGGGSDIVGRIVAIALTESWGQSVVVDNRPGAGSIIGTGIAAASPADGYTWLVSSSSIAISPALYKDLPFDIRRDFSGVTLIASQPSILAIHASVPANNLKELIAYAKTQPGKLTYGSAGAGSATHLGGELFKYQGGVDFLHVPYKSAGQATAALLAGEVQILVTNMASVLPHVKGGRIKALGVSSARRSPLASDLPTIAEAGLPGFEYATWYGMLVPARTSKAIVGRIHADTAKVLKVPQVHERLTAQGLEIYVTPPEAFETYLKAEIAKWDKVIRAAGIKAE
ncbi:MAG: Bug family tripartite tricarboxylate transporter substrate binding protein [Burkholderiales bacterium]